MEKSLCYNIETLFKVYKQKVKHLLFEHQNNISDLKADNVCALKLAQEDHREEEKKLRKDKRGLKVTLKEEELSHEDIIKNLKKVRHKKIKYALLCNFFIVPPLKNCLLSPGRLMKKIHHLATSYFFLYDLCIQFADFF